MCEIISVAEVKELGDVDLFEVLHVLGLIVLSHEFERALTSE